MPMEIDERQQHIPQGELAFLTACRKLPCPKHSFKASLTANAHVFI